MSEKLSETSAGSAGEERQADGHCTGVEEQLRELLMDLELATRRERSRRLESEALLSGSRALAEARTTREIFDGLLVVLRRSIPFENAFMLALLPDGVLRVVLTTSDVLRNTYWVPRDLFTRVLDGQPAAVFDTTEVAEWRTQPAVVRDLARSALHVPLEGSEFRGMLVCMHQLSGRLTTEHVQVVERFAPFVAQAMQQLRMRQQIEERDRFFTLSHDLMCVFDELGQIRQLNPRWLDRIGVTAEAAAMTRLSEFVHPDDHGRIEDAVLRLLAGATEMHVECRLRCKDGQEPSLLLSMTCVISDNLIYAVGRERHE